MNSIGKSLFSILFLIAVIIGCKKDDTSDSSTKVSSAIALTTTAASNITTTSATTGGNITSDGGSAITKRGVCWSMNTLPSYFDNHTSDSSGTGVFVSNLSGLSPSSTYYVRAYAINANDTAYGGSVSFTTAVAAIVLSTNAVTSITSTTAIGGGNITFDGGSAITSRGICWSTAANPTITNSHVFSGAGISTFQGNMTGLTASTTYNVRAFAINAVDTAYGLSVSFTTSAATVGGCGGQTVVTDVEGNVYDVITIGNQCWTKENLKTGHYRNGTAIPTGLNNTDWGATTSGAYAIYNNDPANDSIYGKLYNYYTVVDPAGLCPANWHVPSESEWNIMAKYLEPAADTSCNWCTQSATLGGKMKETGTAHWTSPNGSATNSSSFTVLPAGWRSYNGNYLFIHLDGYFWNTTAFGPGSSYSRQFYYMDGSLQKYDAINTYGLSVRCVKD